MDEVIKVVLIKEAIIKERKVIRSSIIDMHYVETGNPEIARQVAGEKFIEDGYNLDEYAMATLMPKQILKVR